MKLNKTTTALLLLVLIACNIPISNSEQIKNTKISRKMRSAYKRTKLARSSAATKKSILDKLKKEFKDPENILYFSFGVAAEFRSDAELLYKKVKKAKKLFSTCFSVMESAYNFVKEEKDSEDLEKMRKSESIRILEETLEKKENQKEFCENTKKEISENFIKASWEAEPNRGGVYSSIIKLTPDFLLSMSYKIAENMVSKDEFCGKPTDANLAPKTAADLRKKFGTLSEYEKQCNYFNSLNCNIFTPEAASVWSFIKSAYSYYKMVKKTGTCLAGLINQPSLAKDLDLVKKVADLFMKGGYFYTALATTLGVVANVLTFGAWGGIKGGYYLIELGLQLNEFYDQVTEDVPFKIGKLVGKAIVIAESLLLGKRKLFRKMK